MPGWYDSASLIICCKWLASPSVPGRTAASQRSAGSGSKPLPTENKDPRNSPRAGQLPTEEQLVDIGKLLDAYGALAPDPAVAAQRVAFGTSGHRGSSFDAQLQRGARAGDHPGDLPTTAGRQGIDGPLFLGIDTHALSRARLRERARGAGRQRRRGDDRRGRRIHADAGAVARDPRLQPRPHAAGWPTASSSRRRTIRPTTAASSTTRRNGGPADTRRHRLDRGRGERAARRAG